MNMRDAAMLMQRDYWSLMQSLARIAGRAASMCGLGIVHVHHSIYRAHRQKHEGQGDRRAYNLGVNKIQNHTAHTFDVPAVSIMNG